MLLSMHPAFDPVAEGLPIGMLVGRDEGLLARGVGGGGGLNCVTSGGIGGQSVITDCPTSKSIFKNMTRNTSIKFIVCNSIVILSRSKAMIVLDIY